MITIHIPLILRHLSDDAETFMVRGSTVGQCLEGLVRAFPELRGKIFNEKGEVHHLIEIFLNSKSAHPDELLRPTLDGDEIHVVTLLSGG